MMLIFLQISILVLEGLQSFYSSICKGDGTMRTAALIRNIRMVRYSKYLLWSHNHNNKPFNLASHSPKILQYILLK